MSSAGIPGPGHHPGHSMCIGDIVLGPTKTDYTKAILTKDQGQLKDWLEPFGWTERQIRKLTENVSFIEDLCGQAIEKCAVEVIEVTGRLLSPESVRRVKEVVKRHSGAEGIFAEIFDKRV